MSLSVAVEFSHCPPLLEILYRFRIFHTNDLIFLYISSRYSSFFKFFLYSECVRVHLMRIYQTKDFCRLCLMGEFVLRQ